MDLVGENVLVTGGAGFIGSHLVESLLRMGSIVTVYDNFDDFYTGKEANLNQVKDNPKFALVKGSILDYGRLSAAIKGKKIVFHLAAQAGIRYCIRNPMKANEVNATGTMNVLLASKENEVKKVVNASSSSIYGNPVKVPIGEEHPLYPTSAYGASKLAAEKYCYSFFHTYNLPVTSLRYFSVYGPRGRPDQVLYSFAKNVSEGSAPVIYGDGHQSRDFTYVSDIVSGTVMAAMADGSVGESFNLGFGEEFSIAEAARQVLRHFGSSLSPKFEPAYRGDFQRTLCRNEKARRILSWTPRVGFQEGLDLFLDWYSETRQVLKAK